MPNITIGKKEGDYLRECLQEKYERETKKNLIVNSFRPNYVELGTEISEDVRGKRFVNFSFSSEYEAGDAQLQKLFFVKAVTFRDDFVNACYCYAFGQTRNTFLKEPKNAELINSWRVQNVELPPDTEGVRESDEPPVSKEVQISDVPKASVPTKDDEKSSPTADESKSKTSNWVKMALFAAFLAIIGLTTALIMTQYKLHKTFLWYKPLPIEEEIELKEDLAFVNTPIFRESVRNLMRPLIEGQNDLIAKKRLKPDNNIMEWYRTNREKNHFCFWGQGNYRFCMDRCNWTGFTKEENPSGGFIAGVEDSVYTLFSKYANVLLGDKLKDSIYLNTLFNIPTKDYTAVLLYVGYKADTSKFYSRELMVRYPNYDIDFIAAGKGYVMTSRPWWRDATDTIRRQKFSWADSLDNRPFFIGLSTPYPTIRSKSPNQRCLWVEIPLKPPTVMIMGIDLLKND